MEIFGLTLKDFIFQIFLPFLLFFLLLYALLRKAKIFSESANRLNLMLSLIISALGIFSLYYLGLVYLLPFLAAFLVVTAFASIFIFGIGKYSIKKLEGVEEKEKMFDAGIKKCEEMWESFNKTQDPLEKIRVWGKLESEIGRLEQLAKELGKDLKGFEWYKKYKELEAERQAK